MSDTATEPLEVRRKAEMKMRKEDDARPNAKKEKTTRVNEESVRTLRTRRAGISSDWRRKITR